MRYFEEARRVLKPQMEKLGKDKHRGIGIEVPQHALPAFHTIYQQPERHAELFRQLYQDEMQRVSRMNPRLEAAYLAAGGVFRNRRIQKRVLEFYRYWFEIYALAREHGLPVHALEQGGALSRWELAIRATQLPMQDMDAVSRAEAHERLWGNPIRENIMARNVLKYKPAIIVVGSNHLGQIREKIKGHMRAVLMGSSYRPHPETTAKIKEAQEVYAARKTASRKRRLKMGITRRRK